MSEWNSVCVVGMGYIGLPTCAVLASQGLQVKGVDVNKNVVTSVNKGLVHIVEPDLDGLIQKVVASGMLTANSEPSEADAYVIAVPTPILADLSPDVSFVVEAGRSIAPFLKTGDLVILESTSPVGTTRSLSILLAELRPDLKFPHDAGEAADILVAYSPERVLPGKVLSELVQNDRSIGGLSRASSAKAASLYAVFVKGELVVTTAETAELVKLTENAFRDVNIAFANELAAVCRRLDINVWELISIANRHPRVNILQPGPGVGGHCIAVDPYFIVHSAPEEAKLIKLAREVNSGRPQSVVDEVLSVSRQLPPQPTVACLGLSFKANIDDMRESPAIEVVQLLANSGQVRVVASDPYAKELPSKLEGYAVEFKEALVAIDEADIVVLLVDHRQYGLVSSDALSSKAVIDTRGVWTSRRFQ